MNATAHETYAASLSRTCGQLRAELARVKAERDALRILLQKTLPQIEIWEPCDDCRGRGRTGGCYAGTCLTCGGGGDGCTTETLYETIADAASVGDVYPRNCAHGVPLNVVCGRCE